MPFTYILFSQTLDRFYISSTELPPEERLKKAINSFKKVKPQKIFILHKLSGIQENFNMKASKQCLKMEYELISFPDRWED